MTDIDDEWDNFINNNFKDTNEIVNLEKNNLENIPQPSDIYISTKSKIAFLNVPVDLDIFWNIPIIPYYVPTKGIIKKQIKINSKSLEELNVIEDKLKTIPFYDVQVISKVHNPTNRNKFKDTRKISIGLCKKDILSYRCKRKQAFYNCFVIILRLNVNSVFKEFHIKIFNTGKLEIPGVQNDEIFDTILNELKILFQPYFNTTIGFNEHSDTVLINSNFNCGFYINREALFEIITQKYGLHAIYDPCSYPGVQCKFYYDYNSSDQSGVINDNNSKSKGISFMIFRTGSVLIVGICEEKVLLEVYDFIKQLLMREYQTIHQYHDDSNDFLKEKKKKIRKKNIYLTIPEP